MNIIPPSPPNRGGSGGRRPNRRPNRRRPSNCEMAMWHQLWAKAIDVLLFLFIFIIAYFITFIQRINPFNQEQLLLLLGITFIVAIIIGVLYLLYLWMVNQQRRLGGNRRHSRLLD